MDRFIEASASIAAYPALDIKTRMKYFEYLLQSTKGLLSLILMIF